MLTGSGGYSTPPSLKQRKRLIYQPQRLAFGGLFNPPFIEAGWNRYSVCGSGMCSGGYSTPPSLKLILSAV